MSNQTSDWRGLVPAAEPRRVGDRAELEATTRDKLEELERRARGAGLEFALLETVRYQARQAYLYAQGRVAPFESKRVVTNAKLGETWHDEEVRRAFDVVLLDAQGKAWWDAPDERWEKLGRLGKSCGLTWGGDFPGLRDLGHFQNDRIDLEQAKRLHRAGDVVAVREVDLEAGQLLSEIRNELGRAKDLIVALEQRLGDVTT